MSSRWLEELRALVPQSLSFSGKVGPDSRSGMLTEYGKVSNTPYVTEYAFSSVRKTETCTRRATLVTRKPSTGYIYSHPARLPPWR